MSQEWKNLQEERLKNLTEVLKNLEDTLFEKEVLDDLKSEPRSLLALYRIATESADTIHKQMMDEANVR